MRVATMIGFGMPVTRAMASKKLALLGIALAAVGCGPQENNSPDMGAVAPKPNFNASSQAPGAGASKPALGSDAAAMRNLGKKR